MAGGGPTHRSEFASTMLTSLTLYVIGGLMVRLPDLTNTKAARPNGVVLTADPLDALAVLGILVGLVLAIRFEAWQVDGQAALATDQAMHHRLLRIHFAAQLVAVTALIIGWSVMFGMKLVDQNLVLQLVTIGLSVSIAAIATDVPSITALARDRDLQYLRSEQTFVQRASQEAIQPPISNRWILTGMVFVHVLILGSLTWFSRHSAGAAVGLALFCVVVAIANGVTLGSAAGVTVAPNFFLVLVGLVTAVGLLTTAALAANTMWLRATASLAFCVTLTCIVLAQRTRQTALTAEAVGPQGRSLRRIIAWTLPLGWLSLTFESRMHPRRLRQLAKKIKRLEQTGPDGP